MSGPAETIAKDIIEQMARKLWVVEQYTAHFRRMYVVLLEDLTPAGDATSKMEVVFAPVGTEYERIGWGAARKTVTLGILFRVAAKTARGEVTDTQIDKYEEFVDEFCTWLVGPRKFATAWSARDPMPIFGDHFNDHLYDKGEFHVPVLVDFFCDVGAD